ncbi:MAG: N-acetylmuramoyl-L-alanine amidase, partial [Dehalococcoidia bacterium]
MPQRIGRRKFLQASISAALAGVAYGATLGMPALGLKAKPSARRVLTKDLHLGPPELAKGSRSGLTAGTGGLKLGRGRGKGYYLSPILHSGLAFNYVGLYWSGLYPEGGSVAAWLRTSPDGHNWSPWETVHPEMEPSPLAKYDSYSALIGADRAHYAQFFCQLRGAKKKPALRRIGLTFLNPYDGPPLETAAAPDDSAFGGTAFAAGPLLGTAAAPAEAASGKPITFRRQDWGADESLRFSGGREVWPRSYVPTKKLIVHHTVTGNGYRTVAEAKALVRAIYTYHARTLGWGDIGYNSLIDKFGNSYEGRRGRAGPRGREVLSEDVVGGHALAYNYGSSGIALLGTLCTPSECSGGTSPSPQMISRLRNVLAWECRRHGIRPRGRSDFLKHNRRWHRDLPNIVGHRNVYGTTCPGGYVYTLLPRLRRDVAARLANSAAPSVSIISAPPAGTVRNGKVVFAWRGRGSSGGLKYSYCLEGWSKPPGTSVVKYIRGFTSRKSQAWSPWRRATKASLCFVVPGLYTFHVRVKDSRGRVGVYQGSRTFLGATPTRICGGALLQGTGPGIYVVQKGLKRPIPNPVTFEAKGFLPGNVNHVPNSFLKSIPRGQPLLNVLAKGNLLKASGPTVYVMGGGGRKRPITSPSALKNCGYGWDAVQKISGS